MDPIGLGLEQREQRTERTGRDWSPTVPFQSLPSTTQRPTGLHLLKVPPPAKRTSKVEQVLTHEPFGGTFKNQIIAGDMGKY